MKIKLIFTLAIVSCFLWSCSNSSKDFCACLEESQKLDAIANQVLLGNDTDEQTKRLIEARETQAQACKDFELSSGEEMKEWMKDCETP